MAWNSARGPVIRAEFGALGPRCKMNWGNGPNLDSYAVQVVKEVVGRGRSELV